MNDVISLLICTGVIIIFLVMLEKMSRKQKDRKTETNRIKILIDKVLLSANYNCLVELAQ